MKISFLGGAKEVGRSTYLIEAEKNTLLDCGVKVEEKKVEYPLLEKSDVKKIDKVILSHAHLDHSGYLPWLYAKGYDGKVLTTKPTRDLTQVLLSDYLRIAKEKGQTPYSQENLLTFLKKTEAIELYSQKNEVTFYNAGHILGSAITQLKAGNKKIIYTGDINLRPSRLLEGADSGLEAEILIIESTYGGKEDKHTPTKEAGKKFIDSINQTLKKGGKILVPTFAIGRGQEVLFTIESYMRSGSLEKIPIYLDGMINKALRIYRHNAIYLKKEIQHRILTSEEDPFKSEHFLVPETKDRSDVLEKEKAIILATSGMLNGGPVLTYLEKMAEDPRNKLILVGFQAEGTRGRMLLEGEKQITLENGKTIEIKMQVDKAPFTAHSDHQELLQFIKSTKKLQTVFIVHGENGKPNELAEKIEETTKGKVQAIVPELGEEIRI